MKTKIIVFLMLLFAVFLPCGTLNAHDQNYEHAIPRTWELKDGRKIVAFFSFTRDGKAYLETEDGSLIHIAQENFCERDRTWIGNRNKFISSMHEPAAGTESIVLTNSTAATAKPRGAGYTFWLLLAASFVLAGFVLLKQGGLRIYRAVFAFVMLSLSFGLYSFVKLGAKRMLSTTNPGYLDSAFSPFKPNLNTRWDNNYFYVDCKGIPAHSMMVGITSWQQQVPIPQCYIGSNAWSIPLNPVKAAVPVPVNNKHFLRGAVALAVNGVPIFNPYTNTGVDAFLDGQLDNWGGHSGRADDYHYHIAPMFLEAKTGPVLPIAFALDGYAVYGSKEPDGSAMLPLDANHGHTGMDGRYHYHGSSAAPYMIGNMVGQVTEDTTLQIVPQPAAKGVRPALTPLKGAAITGFHANGTNGYTLIYTLSGATDSVVYSWNTSGNFVYEFYTTSGKTTSNYTGKPLCEIPVSTGEEILRGLFSIYPNPAREQVTIVLGSGFSPAGISRTSLYNAAGVRVQDHTGYTSVVQLTGLPTGIYWLRLQSGRKYAVQQVLVR